MTFCQSDMDWLTMRPTRRLLRKDRCGQCFQRPAKSLLELMFQAMLLIMFYLIQLIICPGLLQKCAFSVLMQINRLCIPANWRSTLSTIWKKTAKEHFPHLQMWNVQYLGIWGCQPSKSYSTYFTSAMVMSGETGVPVVQYLFVSMLLDLTSALRIHF